MQFDLACNRNWTKLAGGPSDDEYYYKLKALISLLIIILKYLVYFHKKFIE